MSGRASDEWTIGQWRILPAVLVASAVGAVSVTIVVVFAGSLITSYPFWTRRHWPSALVGIVLVAGAAWLVGLLTVGAAGWWWLHRNRRRGWRTFTLTGAAAPAVLSYLFALFAWPNSNRVLDLLFAGLLAGCGALVGLTLWRVAYRRVHRGPDIDAFR